MSRKHLLNAVFLLLVPIGNFAQTQVIFTETFNDPTPDWSLNTTDVSSSASANNRFLINNVYGGGNGAVECILFPVPYPIPATPGNPNVTDGPNSGYLHIASTQAITDNILSAGWWGPGACNPAANSFARMNSDFSTLGFTNVTLSFWWLGQCANNLYGELYYSLDGGSSWTIVNTPQARYNNKGTWTEQTISIPALDNQPKVRFGFRFVSANSTVDHGPLGFSVDELIVSGEGASQLPQISTVFSPQSVLCPGTTIDVDYTSTGSFDPGNVFSVQLSDANGSFSNPTEIGSITSDAGSGSISVTIPASPTGSAYQVRVVSSSPAVTGTANQSGFQIGHPASAAISASTTAICNNETVTLNYTGTPGTVIWISSADGNSYAAINGASGNTYTSGSLSEDIFYKAVVSSDCGTDTSDAVQISVGNVYSSISATGPTTLCVGQTISLDFNGSAGTIQWESSTNGSDFTAIAGANGPGFTSSPVTETIWFRATVTADCGTASSNSIEVSISPVEVIVVESTPPGQRALCEGEITLNVSGNYTNLVWLPGGESGASLIVTEPGNYSVNGINEEGCPAASEAIEILDASLPVPSFTYEQVEGYLIQFTNTSVNGSSYAWQFGAFGSSTIESPSFSFPFDGIFPVKLVITNDCGKDSIEIQVAVIKNSIEDWKASGYFEIYPNPFAEGFSIKSHTSGTQPLNITLEDLSGRVLEQHTIRLDAGQQHYFHPDILPKGMYLLKFDDGQTIITRRLIHY